MSAASTSKCVFCAFARPVRQTSKANRSFSTTPTWHNRKPKFASVRAPETRLDQVPKLSEEELERNFSQKQRAAILAANKVVNNENISQAGTPRSPWALKYIDDLTQVDPVADHPIRAPWQNIDEKSRLKTDEEITEDFYKLMNSLPEDDDKAVEAWRSFDENTRLTVGREEAERNPRTALAPELQKLGASNQTKPSVSSLGDSGRTQQQQQEAEPTAELLRLMQMTGLTRKQISGLRVKTIVRHYVVNQTRLGKINKMYVLSVAGNGNGLVGIGEGKSMEASEAVIQSQYRAIRNMRPILRYENRTIFGDVDGKVSATELELYARPPGFGLRCSQYIFEICRAAGISDLAARVTRSRNPMNTVKAAIQALMSQKDPEEIAKARGKKLVDVRKVYYANQV